MSVWNDLGFSDNPYSARPISPDDIGAQLLVGRDEELARLIKYLRSADTHPTLEGPNGVGKTSLVAVAGFSLLEQFRDGKSNQALIPLPTPFQLTPDDSLESFRRRVLFAVAQQFINANALLKERGLNVPDSDSVAKWLNSPVMGGIGFGATAAGFGGSAQTSTTANTSAGFSEAGFAATIRQWLTECFPSSAAGGFICVIDNLELLDTSKTARALLEAIRDDVLNMRGLRWVLCGARGIIRSAASSPRLQGVLADPMNVDPVGNKYARNLIEKRIDVFRVNTDANAPVEGEGFEHIYAVGNYNLRNALKYCEDFSFWAHERSLPNVAKEKREFLEAWMAETADKYELDTKGVGSRAWQVFDEIASIGGSTAPSEYEMFKFESQQAMRPHLKALEDAQLIESAIDETDNRRKTISITSRGWIVQYKRTGFKVREPGS